MIEPEKSSLELVIRVDLKTGKVSVEGPTGLDSVHGLLATLTSAGGKGSALVEVVGRWLAAEKATGSSKLVAAFMRGIERSLKKGRRP
jgi:hypothetical protein